MNRPRRSRTKRSIEIGRTKPIGALRAMALAGGLLAAMPAPASPRVAGVAAYLLNANTGTLSADVARTPDALGNAVAGRYAAHSALIVVKIAYGRTDPMPPGQRVRLLAVEDDAAPRAGGKSRGSRRIVLDRTVMLGPIGADGITHAGFWLDDIGCAPLRLDASLLTRAAPPSRHLDLPFQCYE